MILDLTGMEIANASLLDEATAASESMIMFLNSRSRADVKAGKNKFFISENCFPQTIEVVVGHAKNLGIDLTIGDESVFEGSEEYFGAIIQYPNKNGVITDIASIISRLGEKGIRIAVGADTVSYTHLRAHET